ncbi:MAG: silent information regulator protein Sir2 [Verrucomicrobiae bacterium]|nr:silent information regulator protein Sir2 [Verrucomicrobiae bacterium]
MDFRLGFRRSALRIALAVTSAAAADRLDRGLVAVRAGADKVHISWRLLPSDAPNAAFNVFRRVAGAKPLRLSATPITATTSFMDESAPQGAEYSVNGEFVAPAPFVRIPFRGNYTAQSVAVADLDGDGKLDYVIKQPEINIDPYVKYWRRSPGTFKLEAYRHDGKPLWQFDLGWAIEQGIWYSPFVVYDLDGDGKAEVALKLGEGDPRDTDGRVQSGPEYLAILDGRTGRPLCRTNWPERELFATEDYNRASRNQLCIAYLDGKTPSIIVNRGTYRRIVVEAWQYRGRKLQRLWRWDNQRLPKEYSGQGSHMLQAADINNDGRDEIIVGSCVISTDGKELWTTGLGHPDSTYIGKLDPAREGLQIYYNIETRQQRNGMCMVDAATGKILWGYDKPTKHIHSFGLCSDIDPSHPGWECYGADSENHKFIRSWLWSCRGELISDKLDWGFGLRTAWWDADRYRELIRNGSIFKYNGPDVGTVEGRFLAVADILGDWREEIITTLDGELRIYSTPLPAKDRRFCLLYDRIYRNCVARQTSGYYQCPTLSFDP